MKKYKNSLMVFCLSLILILGGAVFRFMWWPGGIQFIALGLLLGIVGLVMFIVQLMKQK